MHYTNDENQERKVIIKLKRREMLFYLSYVIVYISLFIGDVYNGGSLDAFARYLRICSYV